MENLFQKSLCALVLGASVLAFSTTYSFASEVVTSTVDPYVIPYPSGGGGGSNTDYAFRFNLSEDLNWTNFESGLQNGYSISDAILHVWLTPLVSGFDSDRHRFFTTPDWVTDNSNLKLTPIHGGGIGDQVVRLKQELGIHLDGVEFVIGQPAEYKFDLTDWYSRGDIGELVLTNLGILNIGYADDAFVLQGKLSVTAVQNPEPASLLLFGSGLVGLGAWRLRKNRPRARESNTHC